MSVSSEERRRRRVRRVLENPEERMNRIFGIKPQDSSVISEENTVIKSHTEICEDPQTSMPNQTTATVHDDNHSASLTDDWNCDTPIYSDFDMNQLPNNICSSISHTNDDDEVLPNEDRLFVSQIPDPHHATELETINQLLQSTNRESAEKANEKALFFEVKLCVCLLVGCLARISLAFPASAQYVQTIFYPFVTLEIAFYGYTKAASLDISEKSSSLFFNLLVLSGINKQLRTLYETLANTFSVIFQSFACYFFAFILTHFIINVFG